MKGHLVSNMMRLVRWLLCEPHPLSLLQAFEPWINTCLYGLWNIIIYFGVVKISSSPLS